VELQGLVKNAEAIIADGTPPLRDGARFLQGSRQREAVRRPIQALRDRGRGVAGIVVRPIHRLLKDVPDWRPVRTLHAARDYFSIQEFESPRAAYDGPARATRSQPAFVLIAPPGKPSL
jgi:hypothetical protein